MKEYFSLQHRIINRKLTEFGLRPSIAYILAIAAFTSLVLLLYAKTDLAKYVLILLYLASLSPLNEKKRNSFLKSCFPLSDYRKLRLIENILFAIPFAFALLAKLDFLMIPVLIIIAIVFARTQLSSNISLIIPSPFSKRPFEFSVGFRKTFYLFLLAYILAGISIVVDNANLGIFAILLIFAVSLSFYANKENEYYIWSFACSPAKFLLAKIKTAAIYASLICIPILIGLLIVFPEDYLYTLVFMIVGLSYLITTILAKYSAYPNDMSLPQVIIMFFCIILPPIMLFVIPSLFRRSVDRLKVLLA
ncbi:hypothetical protein N9B82_05730 [Saprospiraceae bacterium]|nr:hypothetical protein [Saprospiraceae bacterium]